MEMGFEVFYAQATPSVEDSLLLPVDQIIELSAPSLAPSLCLYTALLPTIMIIESVSQP